MKAKTTVLVNIRSENKKSDNVIYVAKPGETFEVLKESKTWTKVKRKDLQGFIMTKFLEIKEEGKKDE